MASEMTHWGKGVSAALKARGVDTIFTLSGGHIFPIYDGAVADGIRLIDFRHEQSAAFAAEGWARLGRRPGVAAVTAGPGVLNAINPLATAQMNGSSLVLLGGRAPESRWGMGSLQEIDHLPVVASLCKHSATAGDTLVTELTSAIRQGRTAPRGPVFFDFSLDLMAEADAGLPDLDEPSRIEPNENSIGYILDLLAKSERPVLLAGSNVYADGAWEAMTAFAEAARIPVFTNGMGRGTIPADHELAFSRSRGKAFQKTDLAIIAGTPFDFRISFGDRFPSDAAVVHLDSAPELITTNRKLDVGLGADLDLVFSGLANETKPMDTASWLTELRSLEVDDPDLLSDQTPIHPMRIYGELRKFLDRDAIVINDGGDFVSYAGREISSYVPGSWLDPGPFGCLGTGPGYAIAAKLMYPDRQVLLLLGDGAFGFSGMEFDTMVRHKLPIVAVVGNNGIWALEKNPMRMFFGYDVVADLRQETRYDQIVEGLGGYGETVTDPREIQPALKRAFDAGVPALLNVITDPEVIYPRSANLA
ncbi:MAG: acetolactate synthase [Actinomycetota bacterium]